MRFGTWIPLEDAQEALALATPAPGLFQLRVRDGLLDFPAGKSAMVAYGGGPDLRAALLALLDSPVGARALSLGPLLCRCAAPDPSQTPEQATQKLRRQFVDRFGAPPAAEQ